MQQTSLYIPKPCHEDWNKMTPNQQGKFCRSCNKQVTDFSIMSDQQVLHFLSNQSGRLCGRFDATQLQRPLTDTTIKKKKSRWLALTMPLLFLFNKSEAQGEVKLLGDTISTVRRTQNNKTEQLMGKVAVSLKQIIITGKAVNENDEPLARAIIIQKGTQYWTTTDSAGNFSLNIYSNDSMVTINASFVGFEPIEKQIQVGKNDTVNITMKKLEYAITELVGFAGAISVCHTVKTRDIIETTFKKIFNTSAFRIYPNPVVNGSTVRVEIKQAGEYQLQLLDNQSRLITVENITNISDKLNTSFVVPSNITAGIYYLRLINEQTKKQYTEKLIVQ